MLLMVLVALNKFDFIVSIAYEILIKCNLDANYRANKLT